MRNLCQFQLKNALTLLGVYRDPSAPLGFFADNPLIYSARKMDYTNVGIGAFKSNYGIAGTFATRQAVEGSSRIFVYGIKETMQPTSWVVEVVKKVGEAPATRWSLYDWQPVTEDVARSLSITKEAEVYFTK